MNTVIEVERLRKVYGSTIAVDEVSFEVAEGEIFGVVGPNGAGKTTTVECIQGLRRPDGGRIRVLGLDPQSEGRTLKPRIGPQLQESALPDRIRPNFYSGVLGPDMIWRLRISGRFGGVVPTIAPCAT